MYSTANSNKAMELPNGSKVTIDNLVDLYRDHIKIPYPTRADISNDGPESSFKLRVVWRSCDSYQLGISELVSYYNIKIDDINVKCIEEASDPTDVSNILAFTKSQKSNKVAQICSKCDQLTGKPRQVIEILGDNFKLKSWDAEWFYEHGPIITNEPFASFTWSKDEKALVYVAESNRPKAESYFKFKQPNIDLKHNVDENYNIYAGQEFIYREDWGESFESFDHTVICVLNVETDELKIIALNDKTLGQPFFIGDGHNTVGFVGWSEEPIRQGLTYCLTRPSLLFSHDFSTSNFNVLAGSEKNPVAIRSPRISNDGKKLVYLENSVLGPHFKACRVMLIQNLCSSSITTKELVGLDIDGMVELKAIYTDTESLPDNCWSQDDSTIVFSSMSFNNRKILALNTVSGKLNDLKFPSASGATVLTLKHDVLVVSTSSINRTPTVYLTKMNTESTSNLAWICVGKESKKNESLSYIINEIPSESNGLPVYSFLIGPKDLKTGPCIVMPHGGPHLCFVDDYIGVVAIFARLGFKTLLINYRGSAGFDEKYINSLPGFVGDIDVKDCISAINYHVKNNEIDKNELVLWGASHGGFLVAHLSGQYSSQFDFKSCICENPVTDLSGMMEATDVPDWIWTEALKTGDSNFYYKNPNLTEEEIANLFKKSPIYHLDKVKAPTLLLLGRDDRRVPMTQGIKYYNGLRARGVSTKCYVYNAKDDLCTVDVEADAFINIIVWILDHWK